MQIVSESLTLRLVSGVELREQAPQLFESVFGIARGRRTACVLVHRWISSHFASQGLLPYRSAAQLASEASARRPWLSYNIMPQPRRNRLNLRSALLGTSVAILIVRPLDRPHKEGTKMEWNAL